MSDRPSAPRDPERGRQPTLAAKPFPPPRRPIAPGVERRQYYDHVRVAKNLERDAFIDVFEFLEGSFINRIKQRFGEAVIEFENVEIRELDMLDVLDNLELHRQYRKASDDGYRLFQCRAWIWMRMPIEDE